MHFLQPPPLFSVLILVPYPQESVAHKFLPSFCSYSCSLSSIICCIQCPPLLYVLMFLSFFLILENLLHTPHLLLSVVILGPFPQSSVRYHLLIPYLFLSLVLILNNLLHSNSYSLFCSCLSSLASSFSFRFLSLFFSILFIPLLITISSSIFSSFPCCLSSTFPFLCSSLGPFPQVPPLSSALILVHYPPRCMWSSLGPYPQVSPLSSDLILVYYPPRCLCSSQLLLPFFCS